MLLISLGIIFLSALGQSCNSQGMTYGELKDNLEVQLELLAKRELSNAELERAAKEYYALFDNTCDSLCEAVVKYNNDMVVPLQERPGAPMDLLRRHYYSSVLYYSPTQAGSYIQQLINEIDPIEVADEKSKRVLKQSDILGLLNINAFIENGGAPKTQTFDPKTIDRVVNSYQEYYAQGSTKLARRLSLAAELWAGIAQNWNKLSDLEKQQVRNYFDPSSEDPIMDEATYKELLALTDEEAADWRSRDRHEYNMARLEAINNRMMDYYARKSELDILMEPFYW
ncbi:MAG: hypothetical protein ACR2MX_15530 [Cyclobacteriaceae bacterium]